ncbi:MAG: hypothetical protein QM731_23490 [Chitinophagaceae bacterium]
MKRIILSSIVTLLMVATACAQEEVKEVKVNKKKDRIYFTSGGNGGIVSFSSVKEDGNRVSTIPRFTLFFNIGSNFHYDVSDHVGFFAGMDIKNIGLITKADSVKYKRRVYTLGIPVGFKIGDLKNGLFFYAGAEMEMAFNYKEKYFVGGDKKSKFNEWFSDRTDRFMPSLFAGVQVDKHFSFKAQYYLNNFFNQDYKDGSGAKVYQNTDAKIFFLTLGYNIYHKTRPGIRVKTSNS